MSKREHVPRALHAELSRYSSLLRALRTTTTLDLSSQLTYHGSRSSQLTATPSRDDVCEDDSDISAIADPDDSAPVTRASSSHAPTNVRDDPADQPSSRSCHISSGGKENAAPANVRDKWTKWPLVPTEVHIPEWSFEEEVRLLAVDALNRYQDSFVDSDDNDSDDSDDSRDRDEEFEHAPDSPALPKPNTIPPDFMDDSPIEVLADAMLTPVNLHAITKATAKRLYEILALCTAMLPESGDSMQNRHGYINWELVLNAVDAFGLYSPAQLESIKQRMLALYPKYKTLLTRDPFLVDPKPPQPKDNLPFLSLDWFDPSDYQELLREGKYKLLGAASSSEDEEEDCSSSRPGSPHLKGVQLDDISPPAKRRRLQAPAEDDSGSEWDGE